MTIHDTKNAESPASSKARIPQTSQSYFDLEDLALKLQARLDGSTAEIQELKQVSGKLIKALQRVEWSVWDASDRRTVCPACLGRADWKGHEKDCYLRAALAEASHLELGQLSLPVHETQPEPPLPHGRTPGEWCRIHARKLNEEPAGCQYCEEHWEDIESGKLPVCTLFYNGKSMRLP